MKTTKAILEVDDFGRQLVETGDLDPVYVAVWGAELEPLKLRKWLLAYWCFYHCGTAAWITDQPNYWRAMETAAASSQWPRGTERRHFRAANATKTVAWFRETYDDAADVFAEFDRAGFERRCPKLREVMELVQLWPQFGPWIAFKVADMLERLAVCRIDFSAADTFLFDSPRKGAILVAARYANGEAITDDEAPAWALDYLDCSLGSLEAPPRLERLLNGQEYETILCKWKSHVKGGYHVGHDIDEVREGLRRFQTCKTSQRLLKGLRQCQR